MNQETPQLHLENQLCFPLYAASRLMTKMYAPLLKKLDVTYPQYLVLLVLWQKGEQTVNAIGSCLLLESNTLTPLLKRLEQKELLVRSRAQHDERVVLVKLTPSGQALKEKAVSIPQQIASLFSDVDLKEEDYTTFEKTLAQLVLVLKERSQEI